MKRLAGLLCVLGMVAAPIFADPPTQVNYQGRLVDAQGDAVNGALPILVRLFTVQAGGTKVWEQNLGSVNIFNGLYSVQFGDAALASVLTNATVWIEVEVGGETISPRQRLGTAPYAMRAAVAVELETPLEGFPTGGIAMWSGTTNTIPEGWVLCDGANGTPDLRDRFVMGAANRDPGTTGGAHSFTLTESQMPAHTHSATAASDGAHTHSASSGSAGNHTHNTTTGSGGDHSHTVTSDNSMGSGLSRPGGGVGGSQTSQGGSINSVSHGHTVASLSSGGAHTHTVTINSAGNHTHSVTVNSTGSGASIDNRPAFYAMAFIYKL